MRRTSAALVLALTAEDLQRQPTDAGLLKSGVWSERHLIAPGRIVEESAGNEAKVRRLLGLALRLPDGGLANQRYAEAIFLVARVRDLAGELCALAPQDGAPPWVQAAAIWADTTAKADEKRNQLLHRPPCVHRRQRRRTARHVTGAAVAAPGGSCHSGNRCAPRT